MAQYSSGGAYDDGHIGDGQFEVGEEGLYQGEGQYYAEQDGTTLYTGGEYSTVPDVLQLNHLCANAQAPVDTSEDAQRDADESWEFVREWLRSHNADAVREAAEQRGESSMTALHFACRNHPPLDVINVFLSIALDTVQWPDTFGWLPIHYACACAAGTDVISALAEAYPESRTTVDRRGRTPLHFALGQSNQNPDRLAPPGVVAILSNSGAAAYADENGMIPLHYACAYGASEEALYVLTDAYHEAISTRDRGARTPLHFALSNAGRKASPGAVRHLLCLDPTLANSNGGPLPLRAIADYSQSFKRNQISGDEEDKENVQECLKHLLNANPDPTADFFTALQSLPEWLSEKAVVMPSVQYLLNEKISQRFPTAVLMTDFYVICLIIVTYSFHVLTSIEYRFKDSKSDIGLSFRILSPLYIGCAYFLLREIIQMISLISLKSFDIYVRDPGNWFNVAFIVFVLYWTILMQTGGGEADSFRTGTAISVIVLYLRFLNFLRNVSIEFAVFAGGVFYVFRRLVAFLIVLVIILIGFTQMFVTDFSQREYCKSTISPSEKKINEISCDEDEDRPYCEFWLAFLNVYTMLLGEVDETPFAESTFSTCMFALFMFLCVILLANVLIAIVTDSYKVIQDQRAAIVFWTNRLDFVAEMDAIANGPWKSRVKALLGMSGEDDGRNQISATVAAEAEFWKRLMDLFTDDIDENIMSLEFWIYNFLRFMAAVFIIPMWVLLGVVTAGWLWPPQLREMIFTSSVSKHSSESQFEDELRKTQVMNLQREVSDLKEDMANELRSDRIHVVQMKSMVTDSRTEIGNEMKHIKRIMTMLFEQQSTFDG